VDEGKRINSLWVEKLYAIYLILEAKCTEIKTRKEKLCNKSLKNLVEEEVNGAFRPH
jgi:hypothetical protein